MCPFKLVFLLLKLHAVLLLSVFIPTSAASEKSLGTCPFAHRSLASAFANAGQAAWAMFSDAPVPRIDPRTHRSKGEMRCLAPTTLLVMSEGERAIHTRSKARTRSRDLSMPATMVEDPQMEASTPKKLRKGASGLMEVVVVGLSHHKAAVEVREKLAVPEAQWNLASNELCEYPSIAEAAILSTCNRFEVYFASSCAFEGMKDVVAHLEKRSGLDQRTLRKNLFMLSGEDAIWHILRVSAGLDSLVVGEGQILAQVKQCHMHGLEPDGAAGKVVARLLNAAVTAGKRVRSETGISRGAVSISSAAVEFTQQKLAGKLGSPISGAPSFDGATLCIFGAGKMSRLLVTHMASQGVKKIILVNRSLERAQAFAAEHPDVEMEIYPMDKLWEAIGKSDVVYTSTASEEPVIYRRDLESANRNRPLVIVDISVPRNVEKGCEEVNNVYSFNVDNLKEVVEKNTAMRRREVLEAEKILVQESARFIGWQQSLGAIPTIARLQEKAEEYRQGELKKAAKKLQALGPKELDVVDRLSKGIVNKLLHGPMSTLRCQDDLDLTRVTVDVISEAFQLGQ